MAEYDIHRTPITTAHHTAFNADVKKKSNKNGITIALLRGDGDRRELGAGSADSSLDLPLRRYVNYNLDLSAALRNLSEGKNELGYSLGAD
jgi:hypothetical protein